MSALLGRRKLLVWDTLRPMVECLLLVDLLALVGLFGIVFSMMAGSADARRIRCDRKSHSRHAL